MTRLDRLARSTAELLRIAKIIAEKNAGLQSLEEPWADTTTPAGRMVLTVFAGVAEFERALLRHRTDEGRQAAKRRGCVIRAAAKATSRSENSHRLPRPGRQVHKRGCQDLQRPPSHHPSLPKRVTGAKPPLTAAPLLTTHFGVILNISWRRF